MFSQEGHKQNYTELAMEINPDSIEACEEKFLHFEKAIGVHHTWVFYISSRQGVLLKKMKDFYKEIGQLEGYDLHLEKLKLTRTTANFKIRLADLMEEFPRLKFCGLSLHVVNKYLRQIRKVCEESGDKYRDIS